MTQKAHRLFNPLRPIILAVLMLLVGFCAVPVARAQRLARPGGLAAAHSQYQGAVRKRAALEGRPKSQRTVAEYKVVVAAYHKVYLLTPQAVEVTPALMAIGELYQEMGRQFDPEFFRQAIEDYRFLLKQYPRSRYRSDALLTIANIEKEDLDQAKEAKATYEEFLRRFPRSGKADDAREALKEIAQDEAQARRSTPAQEAAEEQERQSVPRVTNIRTWNAEDYTRIVVDLEDAVKYQSARLAHPDRIYFDLSRARLSPSLAGKTLDIQNGYLKAIRVAQNKMGVVRLVLDVGSVKNYSAFLLSDPYRLVIDVHGEAATLAKAKATLPRAASRGEAHQEIAEAVTPASPELSVASRRGALRSRSSRTPAQPPPVPRPTRDGQRSLTRTLGLKISRIVIDPGHGGHDTGTIGPHGLMEKKLCLDVALRLGRLIKERLPAAEVIYTRKDDTFVPLEERTAIANQAKADLFISIHANSSRDRAARGVETYYLNFATSEEAMEVAARENALSQASVHQLQDIIKKIARNDKIEESKELATDIQDALAKRLRKLSRGEKNRGVKRAPFIVLIGANMPSVLSEISFLSNPGDERLLRRPAERQRVAEGLFHGVEDYLASLNSLSFRRQKLVSERSSSPLATEGNPK